MSGRRRGPGETVARGTNRPLACVHSANAYKGATVATELRGRSGPLVAVRAVIAGHVVAIRPLAFLPESAQVEEAARARAEWALDYPDAVVEEVS